MRSFAALRMTGSRWYLLCVNVYKGSFAALRMTGYRWYLLPVSVYKGSFASAQDDSHPLIAHI